MYVLVQRFNNVHDKAGKPVVVRYGKSIYGDIKSNVAIATLKRLNKGSAHGVVSFFKKASKDEIQKQVPAANTGEQA